MNDLFGELEPLAEMMRGGQTYSPLYTGARFPTIPEDIPKNYNRFNEFEKVRRVASTSAGNLYRKAFGDTTKSRMERTHRRRNSKSKERLQNVAPTIESLLGSEQGIGRYNKVVKRKSLPTINRQRFHKEKVLSRKELFHQEKKFLLTGDEFRYIVVMNEEDFEQVRSLDIPFQYNATKLGVRIILRTSEYLETVVRTVGRGNLIRNHHLVKLRFSIKTSDIVLKEALEGIPISNYNETIFSLKIIEFMDASSGINYYKIRFFDESKKLFQDGYSEVITAGLIPYGEYESFHGLIGFLINQQRVDYHSLYYRQYEISSQFIFHVGDVSDLSRTIGNRGKEKEVFTRTKSSEFKSNHFRNHKFYSFCEYVDIQNECMKRLLFIFSQSGISETVKKRQMLDCITNYDLWKDVCVPIFITEGIPYLNTFCNIELHSFNEFVISNGIIPSKTITNRLKSLFRHHKYQLLFNGCPWGMDVNFILFNEDHRYGIVRRGKIIVRSIGSKISQIQSGDWIYCELNLSKLRGGVSIKAFFCLFRPFLPLLHIMITVLGYTHRAISERIKNESLDHLLKFIQSKATKKSELENALFNPYFEKELVQSSPSCQDDIKVIRMLKTLTLNIINPNRRKWDDLELLTMVLGILNIFERFELLVCQKDLDVYARNIEVVGEILSSIESTSSNILNLCEMNQLDTSEPYFYSDGKFSIIQTFSKVFFDKILKKIFVRGTNEEGSIVTTSITDLNPECLQLLNESHVDWQNEVKESLVPLTSPFRLTHIYQFGLIPSFLNNFGGNHITWKIDDAVIETQISFGKPILKRRDLEDFDKYEREEKKLRYDRKSSSSRNWVRKKWILCVSKCNLSDFLKMNLRTFFNLTVSENPGLVYFSPQRVRFYILYIGCNYKEINQEEVIRTCSCGNHSSISKNNDLIPVLVGNINKFMNEFMEGTQSKKKRKRNENEEFSPGRSKIILLQDRDHGTRGVKIGISDQNSV